MEPTAPRNPVPTERHRRLRNLAIGLICVLTIAGCAEGTARDAERAREEEAEATSVVDTLQSTRTAEIVKGTPQATATAEGEDE